jgi:hypothetical protein
MRITHLSNVFLERADRLAQLAHFSLSAHEETFVISEGRIFGIPPHSIAMALLPLYLLGVRILARRILSKIPAGRMKRLLSWRIGAG